VYNCYTDRRYCTCLKVQFVEAEVHGWKRSRRSHLHDRRSMLSVPVHLLPPRHWIPGQ